MVMVKTVVAIAATGWHVPTDAEWTTLVDYLIANGFNWDNTKTSNKVAKALASKTDWEIDPAAGAPGNDPAGNNRSGFAAFPAGVRFIEDGLCSQKGYFGLWWSATEEPMNANYAVDRDLAHDYPSFSENANRKVMGMSVRAVKD